MNIDVQRFGAQGRLNVRQRSMLKVECQVMRMLIGSTACIVDRYTCIVALAYAEKVGIVEEVKEMILEIRRSHLDWLSVVQRD